jgi:septal ring factor EnvC (AmiA/AmiB activator)
MPQAPDPWRGALDRWTQSDPDDATRPFHSPPDGAPSQESQPRTVAVTTPRIIAVSIAAVVLLAAAVGGGVLTVLNRDRADTWRARSVALEDIVAERTTSLNRQTARLNVAATTLRRARTAITRSEQDVAQLERRQRQLASEKAAVEDQRAQVTVVAASLLTCNSGLVDAINAIAAGTDPAQLDFTSVSQTCQQANDAVQGLGN